jgi:hypothetical protein
MLRVFHLTRQLGQLACLAWLLLSAQQRKQQGSCRAFGALLAVAATCRAAHLRTAQRKHAATAVSSAA